MIWCAFRAQFVAALASATASSHDAADAASAALLDREIGVDLSSGYEYRPLLNNNVIFLFGVSALLPANGFRQLYNRLNDHRGPMMAGFMELVLTY